MFDLNSRQPVTQGTHLTAVQSEGKRIFSFAEATCVALQRSRAEPTITEQAVKPLAAEAFR